MIRNNDARYFLNEFAPLMGLGAVPERALPHIFMVLRRIVDVEGVLWMMYNLDGADLVKNIRCKVLLLGGLDDKVYSLTEAGRWLKLLGEKGEVLLLEKCGHFPVSEKPMQGLEYILKFLEETIDDIELPEKVI